MICCILRSSETTCDTDSRALGVALRPFRDTRPLQQETAILCRSGLVPRKGRTAAPALPAPGGCLKVKHPVAKWDVHLQFQSLAHTRKTQATH
ncbi:hypothetical protein EJA05_14490 [Pseudomonas oryziphila]|uniref:Uncharacterized protein n=1 Tax=Pseudomonas entomophila TaxID=312306 RepID=A0A3Q8U0Z1_9PSED|nr:hypothetical protein EJA05_14490 [Pseudomonas oryziphila]